jgi:hypothetical protein
MENRGKVLARGTTNSSSENVGDALFPPSIYYLIVGRSFEAVVEVKREDWTAVAVGPAIDRERHRAHRVP